MWIDSRVKLEAFLSVMRWLSVLERDFLFLFSSQLSLRYKQRFSHATLADQIRVCSVRLTLWLWNSNFLLSAEKLLNFPDLNGAMNNNSLIL